MKFKCIVLLIPLISYCAQPPPSKKMRYGVAKGKVDVVRDCLNNGENPLGKWPTTGMTPLMTAIRWEKKDVANLLAATNLIQQASAENNSKQTPLHFAADVGSVEMITKLLQAGADLKHLDANRKTPLLAAITSTYIQNPPKQIQTIKLLFEAANYWLSPEEKQSWPLVLATQNQEIINLLEPYLFKRKMG